MSNSQTSTKKNGCRNCLLKDGGERNGLLDLGNNAESPMRTARLVEREERQI